MKERIKTELIEKYMDENEVSLEEFCRISNICKSDIQKIFVQDFNFGIDVIFKLAKVLKIEVFELFEKK